MRTSIAKAAVAAAAAAAALVSPHGNAAEEPAAPPAPREGCATFTDAKGDAEIGGELPNDPDLDILRVVLASPPGKLRAYIQVEKLGLPKYALGHQFLAQFQLAGKTLAFFAGKDDPATVESAHSAAAGAGAVSALTGVTYGGVTVKDAKVDVVWDTKTSTVVLTTDRAPIEAAAKTPLPDGTVAKAATAKTLGDYVYTTLPADTVTGATPEASDYTIGDNACFAPPEGRITLKVPPSVVAGHVATVNGTLATAAGAGVAGRNVTVAFAGRTVQATSAADGSFAATFVAGTAGSHPVAATWAGDDSLGAATATAPLVVKVQPTSTTLTAAVSGTSVVVRATLLDDLRRPVAGQTITWLVDGRAAGSTRTDSAGRASLRTVRGKTVKATFAGVRNRYAASTASRRT